MLEELVIQKLILYLRRNTISTNIFVFCYIYIKFWPSVTKFFTSFLSVWIAFLIIVLSEDACLVVHLPSWYTTCDLGNACFMQFHVLSIKMMVTVFLITDRGNIDLM